PGGKVNLGAQTVAADKDNFLPGPTRAAPMKLADLNPYFLSKYEMTQAQWTRLAGWNPSDNSVGSEAPLRPVELVSWNECTRILENVGLVLPTEVEWERGARGGTTTAWWTGQEATSLNGAENLADRSFHLAPPGAMPVNSAPYEDWLDDGAVTTTVV